MPGLQTIAEVGVVACETGWFQNACCADGRHGSFHDKIK